MDWHIGNRLAAACFKLATICQRIVTPGVLTVAVEGCHKNRSRDAGVWWPQIRLQNLRRNRH